MSNNWNTPSCSGFLVTSLSDVTAVLKDTESDLIQSLDMLQEELEWLKKMQTNYIPKYNIEYNQLQDRIDKLTAHLKQWSK